MKFCKTWVYQMTSVHPDLKSHCINYKELKKSLKIKQQTSHEIFQNNLEKQCQIIDRIFRMYSASGKVMKKPMFSCLCKQCDVASNQITVSDVVLFAKLNNLTLRKMCKKRDKLFKTTQNSVWLSNLQSLHKFAFMGSGMLTKMCIQTKTDCPNDECPVCLDALGSANSDTAHIILACGHMVCFECMCKLLKITTLKGTIRNLIAQHESINGCTRCPICMYHKAFHNLNVWPDHYMNLLNKVSMPKIT